MVVKKSTRGGERDVGSTKWACINERTGSVQDVRTASSTIEVHHTRQATLRASRNAVLDTQELLTSILSHLDPQSLLRVRRVSKHWNSLILSSRPLLRNLFLLRAPQTQDVQWIMDNRTQHIKRYIRDEEHVHGVEWRKRQGAVTLAIPNPFVFRRSEEGEGRDVKRRFEICETLRFVKRPDFSKEKIDQSFVSKMFVCQPSPRTVEMVIEFWDSKPKQTGFRGRQEPKRLCVQNDTGVTVGDILKAFLLVVGPGWADKPSEGYYLRIPKCAIWCKGVIFVSASDVAAIEGNEDAKAIAATQRAIEEVKDGLRESQDFQNADLMVEHARWAWEDKERKSNLVAEEKLHWFTASDVDWRPLITAMDSDEFWAKHGARLKDDSVYGSWAHLVQVAKRVLEMQLALQPHQ